MKSIYSFEFRLGQLIFWEMGEQYSHLLIAKAHDFSPSATQVEKFFTAMVSLNVVPGTPAITLRVPTGKIREYPYVNPFTGKNLTVELTDHKKLGALTDISPAVEELRDFRLEVAGVGLPKLPPLAIDFNESYHLGVTCHVYSMLRSTSDPHEQPTSEQMVTPYRQTFTGTGAEGYFHNPHNMKVIRVPHAGCSRFWIEFELGKFLCPEISNSLELLNPAIVREAENVFGITFAQGCYWG